MPKSESLHPARKGVAVAQRRRARKLLLQALYQWLLSKNASHEIEAQFRAENEGKIDWEYFHDLFVGITGNPESLDAHLEPHLDRKLSSLDPIERALLYLGIYEFAHRIDIPYRVAINECVELAKVFGATDSHKYINGVLDKLAPQMRALEANSRR
ncbi:MAG: N utilization substance protein B [Pseudohongiella sp.]|nr:MAG: N utilization substance protein B [Pseudohongiella sp.]